MSVIRSVVAVIKLSDEDLNKLESGEFFTREHLNTYTKKQLVEIMLMMKSTIDMIAMSIRQGQSKRNWIERMVDRLWRN